LSGIAPGADGNLWFAEVYAGKIGRVTPSGTLSEFDVPNDYPQDITRGPDGNVWFTLQASIGRITPAGSITAFPVPAPPWGITTGPDGNIWFTEWGVGRIGRFLTP
jgi:virginiamycin B lyase